MRRTSESFLPFALAAGLGAMLLCPGAQAAAPSRPLPTTAAQPKPVTDLASAVVQTSAVIEGVVSEIHYEYSDADGPWTRVVLSDVKNHLGSASGKVELRHFGGRLPNGRILVAAELPVFLKGQRYVVFLRNTAWNVSPVVGNMALRVEQLEGSEVLVDTDGHPVLAVDSNGPDFGAALFDRAPYSGQAAARKVTTLRGLARKPLDRRGFVDALKAQLDTQGLKVSGPFYEVPAGGFKWRGQAVVPHGQAVPAGTGRTEVDTSGTKH